MKVALVAPGSVPFSIGGAENLWWGLLEYINQETPHQADLIKMPSPESSFWELIDSYQRYSRLDLFHFDCVISTKYPAWMVQHPNHICYMQHRLRGLYDTYQFCRLPNRYHTDNHEITRLQRFMKINAGSRNCLAEFFDRINHFRTIQGLPADAFNFPGPLALEVIHFLDGIGLSEEAVKKFAAISENVAGRKNYFPSRAGVQVIHHPSNLKSFKCGREDYLFTVSRLDGPKRIDLLIEAMKFVTADIPLKIAGTGPDEKILKKAAQHDPRISFLGFINDEKVLNLYADALAVPYFPYDEDFGMITVEAMMSAKPVITTTDAGGSNEFVKNGHNGFSVDPTPEKIAERIDYLAKHKDDARRMGLAGKEIAEKITWKNVVSQLLDPGDPEIASRTNPDRRRKISVAVTFPVFPPRGGGQSRVFHLYRQLAGQLDCDIDLVTFCNAKEAPLFKEISTNVHEIRIPKSTIHETVEREISRRVDFIPVTDIVMPDLFHLTPEYIDAFNASCEDADLIVASHPYLLPVITVHDSKPFIYEAHNVEFDLKKDILPDNAIGSELLEKTRFIERECSQLSRFVAVCSEEDGHTISRRYNVDPEKIVVVPNGVDVDSIVYTDIGKRKAEKRRLGLEPCFIGLFMGSWHDPNIDAIYTILKMAPKLPDIVFLIVGSAGDAIQNIEIPANVKLMGVVNEKTKEYLLGIADYALNPMRKGSGTNLKMLEYSVAGIPIVSTPHGARGLAFCNEDFIEIAEIDSFPQAIRKLRSDLAAHSVRVENARQCAVTQYDWKVIARHYGEEINRRIEDFQLGG